jgi:hypothetical protein
MPFLLVPVVLALAGGLAPAAEAKARKDVRLRLFESCPSLISYGLRHAPAVKAPVREVPMPMPVSGAPEQQSTAGGGDAGRPAPAMAPVAGQDFSTTNNQVAGVDEPDIVKTDGSTVFAFSQDTLQAVDVRGADPRVVGKLKLGGYGHQLLIEGDRALVMWSTAPSVIAAQAPSIGIMPPDFYYRPTTTLAAISIKDPSAMRVLSTMTVDGSLISARLTGSTIRVVLATTPPALIPEPGPATDVPVMAATARVKRRRPAAWLPSAVFRDRRTHTRKRRALAHCRTTRHPRSFSGLGMLTVLTIDLSKGLDPVDSDALMAGGEIVYASRDALYVATQRYVRGLVDGTAQSAPDSMTTEIHKFDVSDAGATRYMGSGQVPGFLLSQFAMDDRAGVLRVASTSQPTWTAGNGRPSESYVTTLAERDRVLVQLGQLGGLGSGEQIYAVRFIDDVGYVVTFRRTDPLYTIGLADPAHPRVLGELKILGYSAYLHPAGEGLLIGIGQDATEQGRATGAQISLFDVSNPAAPVRLQQAAVGSGSTSEAEYDHHAFLWWPARELAVLPVSMYDRADSFVGAIGFSVKRTGIAEAGRIQHPLEPYPMPIRRSVVVENRLITVSDAGLKLSRLDTLADAAWVPFTRG